MPRPLCLAVFFLVVSFYWKAHAQTAPSQPMWLPTNPTNPSAANSPIIVDVTTANATATEIRVTVPGIWVEPVTYGNNATTFMRISFPPVEVKGVGFPANSYERGWWDFPATQNRPKRSSAGFSRMVGGVKRFVVPKSALGSNPSSGSEMERLGIDPAGARPGLPRLRAPISMSRANMGNSSNVDARVVSTQPEANFRLPYPVVPAGFEGMDAPERFGGYAPLELVDQVFYSQTSFSTPYTGTEPLLGPIERMPGPSNGAWLSIPLTSLTSPIDLKVVPDFKILLKHLGGAEDFECDIPADVFASLPPFLNGSAAVGGAAVKGLEIEASRSARYLILCPRDWRPVLEEFAQWKAAKGLNVDFLYVGANGDIPDNRMEIDARIEEYFFTHYCHGIYVLICGDGDVIAPGRGWGRTTGDPDGDNADSDHVYEVIGGDSLASVYVGRLSANSAAELKVQLDKILRYEKAPPTGPWPTYVTLCANSETDGGARGITSAWPSKYALAVEQAVNYQGYTNPPGFITLHAGASSFLPKRATNQDVIDTLNDGCGQLFYRGHGNENAWGGGWDGSSDDGASWTAMNHVAILTNSIQPIVYSIACLNSRILQEDSIAEAWMSLPNAGAVAHYGATITSYTSENHERLKGILRAVYELGHTRLGPMLAAAETLSKATSGGGSAWLSNTFCYMLLGDPEMEIRRAAVPQRASINLLKTDFLSATNGSRVRITDAQGNARPGAFVHFTLANGTSANAYADNYGEVRINANPSDITRMDFQLEGYPCGTEYRRIPALRAEGFVTGPTSGNGFKLRLRDAPQGSFRIQTTANLASGNWTDIGNAVPTGADQEFTDTSSTPAAVRFYRAVQNP